MNFENAKNKLKEYAQEHILDYYDERGSLKTN